MVHNTPTVMANQIGPKFTVVGAMANGCGWLRDVMIRTQQYLDLTDENGKAVFPQQIVVPLVESVLLAAPNSCNNNDLNQFRNDIYKAVDLMWQRSNVCIGFNGINSKDAFAQASSDGKQIFIQASWAAVADDARALKDYNSAASLLYKRHVAVGVVKVLHALSHCLTPDILSFEFELQQLRKIVNPIRLTVTPTKVGYKYMQEAGKSSKAIGDMGFGLEEKLTKMGRVYSDTDSLWELSGVHIYKLNSRTNKKKEKVLSLQRVELVNEPGWVERVAGSENPSLSDFIADVQASTKRKSDSLQQENEAYMHESKSACALHPLDSSDDDSDYDEAHLWARARMIETIQAQAKNKN